MKRISTDALTKVEVEECIGDIDWRFYVTAACLLLANIVIAWDVTVISITLPTISFVLHGSAIQSFWLGVSFLVAATTFLPLFSAFADIFGRKPMLITSLVAFSAGSFIAGIAGNLHVLHFGRSVQGIGAGGIFLLSDLIASDLVSPLDKRRLNTALGAIWAIGAVTGPAIGEELAQNGQWRWIFWINLPFCIVATVVLAFFAKLKGATPGSIGPKLAKFDWFGFVLLGGSLVGILLGISWGGSLYTWGHTNTLLPLQFGIIGLVVYCIWSWFSPFQSIISMDGFMDRTSLGTFFGTAVQGAVIGAFLYFMPFFFTVAKVELMSLPPGVRWLPWMLPFVIFVLITFIAVSRWNLWLPAIWLGWALVVLGVSLTTLYTRNSSNAAWIVIAMISGSGIGILYPSLHTASELIAAQDESRARRTITNYTFFHFLGKTVGVAMGTCIFENELLKNLRRNETFSEFAQKYTNDAVALVARISVTPNGGAGSAKEQIMDIYIQALKMVWMIVAVLAALAFINSIFMMPKEKNRHDDLELDQAYVV
ncbi:MFS general substrate transporter [Massarina eburnea CBS 473.64]|uniref:MFS general substrate transporter n=1 Tax=Massarina eburnea CBS 473.64 TaxID=1395130 RepID=A0A6A6RVS5_9PLEO|nr:MFS general substrate transporter [Massarina eburnea CBS 473.64]